jgi:hypothetical protein
MSVICDRSIALYYRLLVRISVMTKLGGSRQ